MAITQAICTVFKQDLMSPGGNLAAQTLKCALYDNTASLAANTTVYDTANEVSSSGTNYTAGGNALTNTGVAKSTVTSYTDFSDTSWTSASFTARGCLIYNSSSISGLTSNASVATIDFGGDKTVSSGTFTIQFPTNDSSDAIIRITS